MNPNDLESEGMGSSSSEEADDDEGDNGEETSASESSSDDDEFDSDDDRVNMVPAAVPLGGQESSDESESEDDEEEEVPAMRPAEPERTGPIKRFDSDVESEYETDSCSESEGLTQKPIERESSIEALPVSQKKSKQYDVSVNHTGATDTHMVKEGKERSGEQHQLDPNLAKPSKKVHFSTKKVQGGAAKFTSKGQSVNDEQKGVHLAAKRKLEQSGRDGETDSADSVPISKRRKNVDAPNGKLGADRNRASVIVSDSGKEIARKTLSDPSVYEKKASAELNKGPQSAQKQKKQPHIWSTDEEIIVASEVLNRMKMGLEVPSKRNDDFWLTLSEVLIEKVGVEFSRDQLCEKFKRMKPRYEGIFQKVKESQESQEPFKFKTNNEQSLFDIWSQIWGRVEVTSPDDQEEPSKPVGAVLGAKDGKNPSKVSKSRPASKAKASEDDGVATGNGASQLDRIRSLPMELGKGEGAAKENHAQDGPNEPGFLSKDVHKVFEEKISATLHELQVWSMSSMEAWMNKALALIDTTVRNVGDQARHLNETGIAGGGLHMRLCDRMGSQSLHGEPAFQQQWYELHLQELNVCAQRLDLLRKECEIRQERLKVLIQSSRGE